MMTVLREVMQNSRNYIAIPQRPGSPRDDQFLLLIEPFSAKRALTYSALKGRVVWGTLTLSDVGHPTL